MSRAQTILGPILNPRADGKVGFIADGAIACDDRGTTIYVGPAATLPPSLAPSRRSRGVICPPFLDAHTHIPQHPIRGRFMEGVEPHPPGGRLIAGLDRNVFPAEGRCADDAWARNVVQQFLEDTLANGVVGGAAYMTVHAHAARIALELLPQTWSVGLVLMNMNCPPYLRTNEQTLERVVEALAKDFGRRFILTDRFAVAVDSPLRQRAVKLAEKFNLRMQTHLNEQIAEKQFVEKVLYPHYKSYTDVYLQDGLLDRQPILAHCVRMSGEEFDIIAGKSCLVAHCPTSNTLLGSGIMPLNEVVSRGLDYAICTDVGASPTTSILAEMAQFLKVHAGRSSHATPSEALYRATLAPARILGLEHELGSFQVGKLMSLIEVDYETTATSSDAMILSALDLSQSELRRYQEPPFKPAFDELAANGLDVGEHLQLLEDDLRATARRLERRILRTIVAGKTVWEAPQRV